MNNSSSHCRGAISSFSQAFCLPVRIKGIGITGGFGTGLSHYVESLQGSRQPEVELITHQLMDGPVRIPVMRAETAALENFVPKRSLRRIDHYSRMAVLGAALALEDAGCPGKNMERTGLIVTSGYGAASTTFSFLDSVIKSGDFCASPTHFSNSVHNAAAAHISILLKITGPSLTISQFETSVASGLLTARQWLAEDRVDEVLFGAVDEYCPVLGYSALRLADQDRTGKSGDFKSSSTRVMGEGSAFMLLSRAGKGLEGYADIVDVQQENLDRERVKLPHKDLIIINRNPSRNCNRLYNKVIKRNYHAAAYSHVYGALPTGQAFDLAAAALMIRKEKVFPAAFFPDNYQTISSISQMSDFCGITCLKLNRGGEYGKVRLARKQQA